MEPKQIGCDATEKGAKCACAHKHDQLGLIIPIIVRLLLRIRSGNQFLKWDETLPSNLLEITTLERLGNRCDDLSQVGQYEK